MKSLNNEEINIELLNLNDWIYSNNALSKEFLFNNFKEAIAFMVRIGFEAENQGHHPQIENVYNKVNITLQTHDAGNTVTNKDIKLAKSIEAFL